MATPTAVTISSANLNGHSRPQPTKLAITPISAASPPASSVASPISGVSTPTSAHQLAIKPAAAALQATTMATVAVAKGTITSKEWVVPPRPKPGRKPATDTPPTKRKAQNRAAQRAFRERRAARVGELEEQLEEQKEEYERTQQQLQDQVQDLDTEVQSLRSKCVVLEDLLEKERAERTKAENELEDLRRRWRLEGSTLPSRNGSFTSHHGRAPNSSSISSQHPTPRGSITSNAPEHRNSTTAFSISQIISPPDSSNSSGPRESSADPAGCGNCESTGPCACVDDVLTNTSVGCGKCSIGTKCECLEAVLKGPAPNSESELKRKPSSISAMAPEEKRQKIPEPYPHEVDFTAMFAKKKDPVPEVALYQPVAQPAVAPRDSCGFCKEGTYCMCAEAAASQTLAPVSQQVQTPPPSENDVGPTPVEVTSTGAIKLPGISSLNHTPISSTRPSTGCGPKGPGTCAQCLRDPKSGLFCRSLAANFARNAGKSSGGCCGGSGGSGCCKSNGSASGTATPSGSSSGISVSCADAYKTLSSHRNFEKATEEIGTWLPRLRAAPPQPNAPARLPIEVEAASIMGVLREFDVRFGRDA
ncbi:uncharacterized protein F4807DRAFT_216041 [Annulohypoxylon truncatum]|uniref:uncharacterized protein n=1 Tax=Annulohypoxylon truncatum TaxID=327061 RepID=UPI002007F540|nr:uncharacterized protein F4807DRAFT_216041 [Annulohypoxylon truncatum]KAI1206819.1 hypothetical protein F4807DRAFT_216041 [Annulohypoxylon truncatum]